MRPVFLLFAIGSLVSLLPIDARAQFFTDVTAQYSMETTYNGILVGGGAAWTDVDGDGDYDLVVACGSNCSFLLFRNLEGAGFAHSFHTPYWMLRAMLGLHDEHPLPVRAYRSFLMRASIRPFWMRIEHALDWIWPKSLILYGRRVAAGTPG